MLEVYRQSDKAVKDIKFPGVSPKIKMSKLMSLLSLPPWAGGEGSLLAQLWPAAFALRQEKLFCRAHSRCLSYDQRLRLRGKVHLTGVLP